MVVVIVISPDVSCDPLIKRMNKRYLVVVVVMDISLVCDVRVHEMGKHASCRVHDAINGKTTIILNRFLLRVIIFVIAFTCTLFLSFPFCPSLPHCLSALCSVLRRNARNRTLSAQMKQLCTHLKHIRLCSSINSYSTFIFVSDFRLRAADFLLLPGSSNKCSEICWSNTINMVHVHHHIEHIHKNRIDC